MIENLKKVYRDNSEIDFDTLWNEGTFIFDTNVLLDLYRLPETARNDLLNVLKDEKFNPRIWAAFQVLLEFVNNRYSVISDQKNKFTKVKKLLEKAKSKYEEAFNDLNNGLDELQLKQRHSVISPEEYLTEENKIVSLKFLQNFIDELTNKEKEQSDVNDKDDIKEIVFSIFEEKIGVGFDKKELQQIYKSGEDRYKNDFPPGYRDKGKKGSYYFEDKEYITKYGDLVLWKEIIEKAKSDNLKSMVLITGDIKPDWWYVQSGKRLGPKKELLNEIYTEAPSLECFYMYDTSNFLKFAKEKLALNIQDSSIAEAKELIELDSINNTRENINIADFCREFSNNFIDLNVVIEKSLFDMPPINIRRNSFEGSIAEIYLNVLHHGYDNTVYITSELSKEESFLSIIFKNKHKNEAESAFDTVAQGSSRGHGRIAIKEWLSKQGIDFITYNNQGYYYFEMFIPKNLFST